MALKQTFIMTIKFYKKLKLVFTLVVLSLLSLNAMAQNQGLYADTVKWPNSNAITVNIRSVGFSNVLNFQGSVNWDKNSLQYVSITGNTTALGNNFLFGTGATAQGVVTYIFSDASANHTVANGTIVMTLNFTVINNPVSTYNDNVISFSNSPTSIGIDTAADVNGLSDFGSLSYPNVEKHTSGYVSFARPPVLSYNNTTDVVTDSISNRPVGTTYQWTIGGNNVAGGTINSFTNPPTGNACLTITYPNGTSVSCLSSVLPVKFTSFTGKIADGKVLLNWLTENEINNKGFVIEKSFNGIDFSEIAFVNANTSASSQHQYSYNDVYSNKASWYRLKQVDNNGKYNYSSVVKVSTNLKDVVSMYPNPSRDIVKVTGDRISEISVSNMLGKTVMQQNVALLNNVSVNVSTLPKGVYNVSVKNATATVVLKLIVE